MERALPALFWRPCLLLKNWKSRGSYLLNCQFSKSFFNVPLTSSPNFSLNVFLFNHRTERGRQPNKYFLLQCDNLLWEAHVTIVVPECEVNLNTMGRSLRDLEQG